MLNSMPGGVHELEQQSSGTVDMKIVCLVPLGQPTISHIHIYIEIILKFPIIWKSVS